MPYEILKKLHDAGFEFNGLDLPTLSQLISACGGAFKALYWNELTNEWCASNENILEYSEVPVIMGRGKNLLTAVANFFIKLNTSK